MKKQVNYNINDYVTVELCSYGVDIYEKYLFDLYTTLNNITQVYNNIVELVDKKITELHTNNRILRLQGWEMMNIFGKYLNLESQPIFKDCIWKVEVDE